MNTKTIASFIAIGIILSGYMVSLSAEEKSSSLILKEEKLWENDQIGVILSKVDKIDVFSPDNIERTDCIRWGQIPTRTEGHDFAIVYLTIARVKNVHVVGLGGNGEEKSILSDAEGHEYKLLYWNVKGMKYLHDWTGPYELPEKTTCLLVFEIPKNEKPAELTFVYYFKETWEGSSKRGQIDIKISSK